MDQTARRTGRQSRRNVSSTIQAPPYDPPPAYALQDPVVSHYNPAPQTLARATPEARLVQRQTHTLHAPAVAATTISQMTVRHTPVLTTPATPSMSSHHTLAVTAPTTPTSRAPVATTVNLNPTPRHTPPASDRDSQVGPSCTPPTFNGPLRPSQDKGLLLEPVSLIPDDWECSPYPETLKVLMGGPYWVYYVIVRGQEVGIFGNR